MCLLWKKLLQNLPRCIQRLCARSGGKSTAWSRHLLSKNFSLMADLHYRHLQVFGNFLPRERPVSIQSSGRFCLNHLGQVASRDLSVGFNRGDSFGQSDLSDANTCCLTRLTAAWPKRVKSYKQPWVARSARPCGRHVAMRRPVECVLGKLWV